MKRRLPTSTTCVLPPLYATWMDQLLGSPIPNEIEATCNHCVMCVLPDDQEDESVDFFNSQTKCCTFMPTLHNFLVGRILSDKRPASAAGRATVAARLRADVAVTPLGLDCPSTYKLLYKYGEKAFGRSRTLRCPYYLEENGHCGVWQHRESACATWFCKHVRGEVGWRFWRAIHQLLVTVEKSLACWCLLELDPGSEALQRIFPPPIRVERGQIELDAYQLDDIRNPAEYRVLWGKWAGCEDKFFKQCARLVSVLNWADVIALCGPETQIFARQVQKAYEQLMSDDIPTALRVGELEVIEIGADYSRVSSYSQYDSLDLPKALIDVLPYFDGRPTREAIKAIAAEQQVELDEMIVRNLADFRILVSSRDRASGKEQRHAAT